MIAAVFRGPGEIEVTEVKTPEIGPDEALVRVGANTVCGTDVRILRGEKSRGVRRPSIIGHEFAGRVEAVGERVRDYEVGMPVAMSPMIPCGRCFYCLNDLENVCENKRGMGFFYDGGLGEYVRVPAEAIETGNLFVAEDLPPEQLALAEPLSCCINGQRRSRVGLDDAVLVIGAGPIGLLHVQLALLAGARTVVVSDPSELRRRFAEDLGAHVAIDPGEGDVASVVAEATGGVGADVAIICVGVPEMVNAAMRLVRKGGRVNVFAGLSGEGWAEVEANLIHYNQLDVSGTTDAPRRDFGAALRLIESGRIEAARMITHRFPLTSVADALDAAGSGMGIKVAVLPQAPA
jgi:L-iditol 2-dehydrogenase